MNTKIILDFLTKLNENNNRNWMLENKNECDLAKNKFFNLTEKLIQGLYSLDSELKNIETKSCIFRLHRDIRFSTDKIPYKNWMSAYVANGGRKANRAGYYIHFQPEGKSLIAVGFYMPEAEKLNSIREKISENGDDFLKLIEAPKFKSIFGELQGEKLKKAPRNFSPNDKFIEFIKFKSFSFSHFYSDDFVLNSVNFLDDLLEKFAISVPFIQYLNNAANQ